MAGQRGLVKRRRVRMIALGIVAARVFASVKQQPDYVDVPILSRECNRAMTAFGVRAGKQSRGLG